MSRFNAFPLLATKVIKAGNGVDDDSIRIQSILNSANNEVVSFEAGKTYVISSSVTVDVSKIKGIIGNNARFVVKNDVPVFKVQGRKNTAGARPGEPVNEQIKRTEMSPFITGIQVYSEQTPYIGTGLQISGTFGLIVSQCHFFNLKKGIELININRNLIFSENHIWGCNICAHWNDTNIHQQNFVNNHLTITEYGILVENGSVHNFQIASNDIEGSPGFSNINLIKFYGYDFSQIQITGNSIEEHMGATGALLHLESPTSKRFIASISGNEFSGSAKEAIKIINGQVVTINGNNFSSLGDYAINFIGGYIQDVNITGNNFSNNKDYTRNMGGIFIESNNRIRNVVISSNTFADLAKKIIVIKGQNNTKKVRIDRLNIVNNSGNMTNITGVVPGFGVDIGEYTSETRELSFIGNQFRTDGRASEKGISIKVAPSNAEYCVIIKNNVVSGVTSGMADADIYDLPQPEPDRIIIADNLKTIY